MRINFAHLCDYALISQDRKLSVMGIFTAVLAQAMPWAHPQMYLAFEVGIEPAELNHQGTIRIECVDEDGQSVFKADGGVMAQGKARIGEHPAVPQILTFGNLTFVRAGEYNINFWLNDRLEHTLRFQVMPPGWTPQPPQGRP